jgi:hypothetical protein
MFKSSGGYQYAECLVNGKTGSRHIPLINSIPFVKDYLDHEHPQPNNQNAPFICGVGRDSLGKHILPVSLTNIYTNYKKEYFPSLLLDSNVSPEDKQRIKELLRKPFNPYIRRHTALTEKSLNPKIAHILNQHAGWTQGSAMREKYLHYFSNTSSESILEAYGIIPTDKKQSNLLQSKSCPQCNEPNQPDSKFCAKCRMVLTYDGYIEGVDEIQSMKEQISNIQESQKEMLQFLKDPLYYTLDKQAYCAGPNISEIRDKALLEKLGIGKDEVLQQVMAEDGTFFGRVAKRQT